MNTYKSYIPDTIQQIPQFSTLSPDLQHELLLVTKIWHFKTNNYVLDHLVDWEKVEEDPIFQLNFPRRERLWPEDYEKLSWISKYQPNSLQEKNLIQSIRLKLLPRAGFDSSSYTPVFEGKQLKGLYHQFPHILLAFPRPASQCHAYCTYCYRWMTYTFHDISYNYSDPYLPVAYIKKNRIITDILFTGGDALFMSSDNVRQFISPLLDLDSLQTIRLGTKTLTWWPYRFISDNDADALLFFFEKIIKQKKQLAIMAHISHPRELETPEVEAAIRRIQATGAIIRCQCPMVKRINDSSVIWDRLLHKQINLNLIPYYMFVESSNTPLPSLRIPLIKALHIYQESQKQTSGLAKTLRGPVLTNAPFKLLVNGIMPGRYGKVFVLTYLQAADPDLVGKIIFAKYDEQVACFEDLILL